MAATAEVLHKIHVVLQMCGIFKRVTCTRLIYNEGFNSLKDFGVIDGDTNVLEMAKCPASRAIATRVDLGAVQIKGLQYLVW